MFGILFFATIGLAFFIFYQRRRAKFEPASFPKKWTDILLNKVIFYKKLDPVGQTMFEIRVQRFLSAKKVTGVDTEVDDTIKLLVASSAIIPTFAFANFNYPNVNEVLIYPNAFNKNFT